MRSFCPPSLHQCSVSRVFKASQSYTERREVETRMWCHRGSNSRPRTPKAAHTPTVPSSIRNQIDGKNVSLFEGSTFWIICFLCQQDDSQCTHFKIAMKIPTFVKFPRLCFISQPTSVVTKRRNDLQPPKTI